MKKYIKEYLDFDDIDNEENDKSDFEMEIIDAVKRTLRTDFYNGQENIIYGDFVEKIPTLNKYNFLDKLEGVGMSDDIFLNKLDKVLYSKDIYEIDLLDDFLLELIKYDINIIYNYLPDEMVKYFKEKS